MHFEINGCLWLPVAHNRICPTFHLPHTLLPLPRALPLFLLLQASSSALTSTPLDSLRPNPCRLSVHIAVQFQDYNIGFIVMKDGTAYLRNDPTTLRGQVGSEIRCEGRLMRE